MNHTLFGSCHCGNLSFALITTVPPDKMRARACDCGFCRQHGAVTWSDPAGSATVRIADRARLSRYRFGLQTADFYICRNCGAYLGALLSHGDRTWSTLNLRLTGQSPEATTASYGDEDAAARIARRQRSWTPTTVISEADT